MRGWRGQSLFKSQMLISHQKGGIEQGPPARNPELLTKSSDTPSDKIGTKRSMRAKKPPTVILVCSLSFLSWKRVILQYTGHTFTLLSKSPVVYALFVSSSKTSPRTTFAL